MLQINNTGQLIPELRHTPNLYEYWMLAAFFVILVVLAYVRAAYTRRLFRLFSSLVRIQILRQVMREELVFSHRVSVLLFINFALVIGLILFGASKFYGWNFTQAEGWELYLIYVALVAGVYLLKLVLNFILRKVLHDPGIVKEYLFEVFLVNKALGVIFLPLAIAICFINVGSLNILFNVIGVLFLLFILFRLFQGLLMSFSYTVSRVYIILYLCTLEILPFMVVWKLFNTEIA
ncbi:DUF4271 domain-containing protein [Cryomorpha ignava]|uniref:DUF4271 domain-containing protein n=1 Tax=Cryomorpha ignava TaxID=101383 RepID=A0A7K3WR53_9FLAO|nr:DUF4271 domain-containing protein [Cryomorpha ignava]NEN23521.1 DUF4271 domain-containing protein [Cryomorpha ignava]